MAADEGKSDFFIGLLACSVKKRWIWLKHKGDSCGQLDDVNE